LITDPTEKGYACDGTNPYSMYFGCGKDEANNFCVGGNWVFPDNLANLAPPSAAIDGACCASSVSDCNASTKCMVGAYGTGTSKFYVALTGSADPVSQYCATADDRCFRISIDCTKETDDAQRLVLCKDANQVSAIAFGCAKNAADNVCTALAVNTSGGTTYDKAGVDGLKMEKTGVKVSATCCVGAGDAADCNKTINCWVGMVGAGTVTATGNFMNSLVGTAAPATKECLVGED